MKPELVVLSARSHQNRRAQMWDIVDVVPDRDYVGTGETREFIWLRMRDVPQKVKETLLAPRSNDAYRLRYSIPVERLSFLYKLVRIDVERVMNLKDAYQPFIEYEITRSDRRETGELGSWCLILDAIGLIYDKEIGRYI